MAKQLIVLLVLAATLLMASAVRREYDLNQHPRALFKEWLNDYPQLTFSADEFQDRYAIFAKNLEKIKQLNVEGAGRTKFMLNKFAHLSEEEFRHTMLSPSIPDTRKFNPARDTMLPVVAESKLTDLPEEFDWRSKGFVTPVKDQGSCGSCWAFSTTGNVESVLAVQGNPLVSLSEQNLVDCDHECVDDVCDGGCNGGLMENALKYILDNGINAEADYKYEGRDATCRFDPTKIAAKIDNFTFVPSDPIQMAHYLLDSGPIAIGADATMWQFYYDGVWYLPCGTSLNHGVLLVGYGVEISRLGTKVPYWAVKNSWGAGWGLDGYILVERGNNRCGLENYPITALVKKH